MQQAKSASLQGHVAQSMQAGAGLSRSKSMTAAGCTDPVITRLEEHTSPGLTCCSMHHCRLVVVRCDVTECVKNLLQAYHWMLQHRPRVCCGLPCRRTHTPAPLGAAGTSSSGVTRHLQPLQNLGRSPAQQSLNEASSKTLLDIGSSV